MVEEDGCIGNKCWELAKDVLSKAKKRVAIFSHKIPDPDALGSMRGMEWIIKRHFGLESVIFYEGPISHPQNRTVVESLDIPLTKASDYVAGDFDVNILLDTIPEAKAGVAGKNVKFQIVIDHHKKAPNGGFDGIYINMHAGSTCAMIYDFSKYLKLAFHDDDEEDSKVATALMVGVSTDTENLVSVDTTTMDFKANLELFPFRNPISFSDIIKWKIPQSWIKIKCEAELVTLNDVAGGVAIAGLGVIQESQRDVIAYVADDIATWLGVDTAVVFGFVEVDDGADRIEGCVRSSNSSLPVANFCEELAGSFGSGGGKTGKGAYCIPLRDMSFEDDTTEDMKQKIWELTKMMQISRIKKIIKK